MDEILVAVLAVLVPAGIGYGTYKVANRNATETGRAGMAANGRAGIAQEIDILRALNKDLRDELFALKREARDEIAALKAEVVRLELRIDELRKRFGGAPSD
jgi:hypothetical protein